MTRLANPFRIIAHRGASGYAPENTMAAFERAVAMGATEVETDVAFTRDGKLLLFHDFTLERTTNGKGLPEDYTLAELKRSTQDRGAIRGSPGTATMAGRS